MYNRLYHVCSVIRAAYQAKLNQVMPYDASVIVGRIALDKNVWPDFVIEMFTLHYLPLDC